MAAEALDRLIEILKLIFILQSHMAIRSRPVMDCEALPVQTVYVQIHLIFPWLSAAPAVVEPGEDAAGPHGDGLDIVAVPGIGGVPPAPQCKQTVQCGD